MAKQYEWEPVGSAPISSKGQITIPKPARDGSGLVEGVRAFVLVEHEMGLVLLTHEPPAEELIDLAAQTAKRKRASS